MYKIKYGTPLCQTQYNPDIGRFELGSQFLYTVNQWRIQGGGWRWGDHPSLGSYLCIHLYYMYTYVTSTLRYYLFLEMDNVYNHFTK